ADAVGEEQKARDLGAHERACEVSWVRFERTPFAREQSARGDRGQEITPENCGQEPGYVVLDERRVEPCVQEAPLEPVHGKGELGPTAGEQSEQREQGVHAGPRVVRDVRAREAS